jgi:hypothetical protein
MTLFFNILEWLLWIFLSWLFITLWIPYKKLNDMDEFVFFMMSVISGSIIMIKFDKID